MGRSKKNKSKEMRSKEEQNTLIEDVGPRSLEDSEPAAVVSEWLGTSPERRQLRNTRAESVQSVFIELLLPAGGSVLQPWLEAKQDCSGSWGDSRLMLPPLSIYNAHLLTQQHVLVGLVPRSLSFKACALKGIPANSGIACAGRLTQESGDVPLWHTQRCSRCIS